MTAVLSGCGSKSQMTADEGEPVSSAPKEVTDAKSLAETLQYYTANSENTVSVRGDGEITASAAAGDTDKYSIEAGFYYTDEFLPSGETRHDFSIRVSSDETESVSGSYDAYAVEEDGGFFTYYMENDDDNWYKCEGDHLKDFRYVSDVFSQIADGSIEAAYTGTEEGNHSLTFTLSGDALCDMLRQYCPGLMKESSSVDWDGVTAEVQADATLFEYSTPDINIQITSSDLAEALILSADGMQSAENADFHAEISCSFYEDYTPEWEDVSAYAEEAGENTPVWYDLTDAFQEWAVAAQDAAYAENFEEINTTDPVTLSGRGVSVTISFPWELRDYGEFHQTDPYSVDVRENGIGGGGHTRLVLRDGSPESILAGSESFYESLKNNSDYRNVEINGPYQLDTENGKIDVVVVEAETTNLFNSLCRDLNYYAVLPLENNISLYLEITEVYNPEEGEEASIQDDVIIGMFNHCGIGGEAPSISDVRCSSLAEYLENPENREEIETFGKSLESDDASMEYTIDGNRLIYTLTFSAPPAGMELDIDRTRSSVELAFMGIDSTLEDMAGQLKQRIAGEEPKIVVIVNTSDGQEIFSQEYGG